MLRSGDVILLAGRLGAGKTVLAAGIGEGLGVEEPLTSPSFILARAHEGFMPVVHADVYRLGSSAEFEDLDLPEQAREGVLLIEWGDVVAHGIPEDHLLVHIVINDDEERTISFAPVGTWADRPLDELTA
jgi:tRNA threonylcarbamoyladenosine biosynthesis protein TsaE